MAKFELSVREELFLEPTVEKLRDRSQLVVQWFDIEDRFRQVLRYKLDSELRWQLGFFRDKLQLTLEEFDPSYATIERAHHLL